MYAFIKNPILSLIIIRSIQHLRSVALAGKAARKGCLLLKKCKIGKFLHKFKGETADRNMGL